MKLNLSKPSSNERDYVKVEFSSDTDETIIEELRTYFSTKQKENIKDLESQKIFLIQLITLISSLDRIRYYNDHENLEIEFDSHIEKILTKQQEKNSSLSLKKDEIKDLLKLNGFKRELELFQLRDLERLILLNHGMNFSVPGAGKTTVSLALHTLLKNDKNVNLDGLLVIAPKNAFGAWDDEIEACFDESVKINYKLKRLMGKPDNIERQINKDKKNYIINYERFIDPEIQNTIRKLLIQRKFHLILDESHKIKSEFSIIAQSIKELSIYPERKDILTGTPITWAQSDIENQWSFLHPHEYLPNANEFRNYFVRTTKRDLKLPPINRTEPPAGRINVQMSTQQKILYSKILIPRLNKFSGKIGTSNLKEMRKCVIQLLQASSNPYLLTIRENNEDYFMGDDIDAKLFREISEQEFSPKLLKAAEIARKLASEGKKTLIWSYFVHNVESLATKLLQDLNAQFIHGGVGVGSEEEEDTREAKIKKFNEDKECMVMVANFSACAEGISLHRSCNNAIYIDRTFQAGHYIQSENRIHRLGNNDKKNIYYLESVTSASVPNIDSRISRNLQRKIQIMDRYLNDPDLNILSDSEDDSDPLDYELTIEDLKNLIDEFSKTK